MDYIHYIFKNILMYHGDYNKEVELGSLCETGVGGLQRWKTLKIAEVCWPGDTSMIKTLKKY